MIKYILLGVIIYLIYIFFFRAKRGTVEQKKDSKEKSQTMVECEKCSVFVSSKEAVIKDGKFYCSKECAKG